MFEISTISKFESRQARHSCFVSPTSILHLHFSYNGILGRDGPAPAWWGTTPTQAPPRRMHSRIVTTKTGEREDSMLTSIAGCGSQSERRRCCGRHRPARPHRWQATSGERRRSQKTLQTPGCWLFRKKNTRTKSSDHGHNLVLQQFPSQHLLVSGKHPRLSGPHHKSHFRSRVLTYTLQ